MSAAVEPGNLLALVDYLRSLIARRTEGHAPKPESEIALTSDGSPLMDLLDRHDPKMHEFATLILALLPHLDPGVCQQTADAAPQGGWIRDQATGYCLPSGQTVCWLVGAESLPLRLDVERLFEPGHWFSREGLVALDPVAPSLPRLSGRLILSSDWVARLMLGTAGQPEFGADFPARRVETRLAWEDIVLPKNTLAQISELQDWQRHRATLLQDWGLGARLGPGYRALFHGPSGTGKTLTATLLGKTLDRAVYRVDLSTVVSKYIGETEKNLARLFAQAERLDAILFFDEADALFGKRTAVKDSHDRYANQEVSYLLQRVEDYDGLVILATNFRANLDAAFLRRFNAIIAFPMPDATERQAIWARCLPDRGDRSGLAEQMAAFELSGGSIQNVVQHAALRAISAGRQAPSLQDALHGVRREVEKDGKVFRNLLSDVTLEDD